MPILLGGIRAGAVHDAFDALCSRSVRLVFGGNDVDSGVINGTTDKQPSR
jgi:hypothetical protein